MLEKLRLWHRREKCRLARPLEMVINRYYCKGYPNWNLCRGCKYLNNDCVGCYDYGKCMKKGSICRKDDN